MTEQSCQLAFPNYWPIAYFFLQVLMSVALVVLVIVLIDYYVAYVNDEKMHNGLTPRGKEFLPRISHKTDLIGACVVCWCACFSILDRHLACVGGLGDSAPSPQV